MAQSTSMSQRPSRHRDTTVLTVGSLVTGVLAYVLFAVTTRHLGSGRAAPVSVLWTYWSLASAAFSFPLQHWVAGSLASGRSVDQLRAALARVWGVVAAAAVGAAVLSWLARDQLFHRDGLWFPFLVGLVTVLAALLGLMRGSLSGRRRFSAVASSLVLENAIRCLAVVLLVVADSQSQAAFGAAIVAGYLVVLCWPRTLLLAVPRRSTQHEVSALGFLGGAAGGQLVAQVVLTGGPVLLALTGGSPAQTTAFFAGLALFRAPYTVSLGVVPQLTVRLSSLLAEGQQAAFGRIQRLTVLGSVVLVLVAAGGGAVLGPWLVRTVFGPSVALSSGEAAVIAAGSGVAIANLLSTVVLMARRRPSGVLQAWLAGVVLGALSWVVLRDVVPLGRAAGVFLVAETAAYVAMLVVQRRAARQDPHPSATFSPGTPLPQISETGPETG